VWPLADIGSHAAASDHTRASMKAGASSPVTSDVLFATSASLYLVGLLVVANVERGLPRFLECGEGSHRCRETDHETCLIRQQGRRACSLLRADTRTLPTRLGVERQQRARVCQVSRAHCCARLP
jgi:hypothetical protein